MYTCITKNDQGGSAANLYENVWGKVLSLPDSTQLYPAHDYKGWFLVLVLLQRFVWINVSVLLLLSWISLEYKLNAAQFLFSIFLLILHFSARPDLHHRGRGEAAQPPADEAQGGVHRPDGWPRPPLPQEDRREPAGQHGVRPKGPSWEDEGLGLTGFIGVISPLFDISKRASCCYIGKIYENK